MATVLYSINPGDTLEDVTVTTPGPAVTAKFIELNVDLGASDITDANAPGGVRAIKRGEVDTALIILRQQIFKDLNLLD